MSNPGHQAIGVDGPAAGENGIAVNAANPPNPNLVVVPTVDAPTTGTHPVVDPATVGLPTTIGPPGFIWDPAYRLPDGRIGAWIMLNTPAQQPIAVNINNPPLPSSAPSPAPQHPLPMADPPQQGLPLIIAVILNRPLTIPFLPFYCSSPSLY